MAEVVKMPKMSDTMTEGVIAKWHKNVGDKVSSGDLIAEVETDKATMDFESFQEGTILYIGVKEGEAVPVDSVIAVLGTEGEDYKDLLSAEVSKTPTIEPITPAKEEESNIIPAVAVVEEISTPSATVAETNSPNAEISNASIDADAETLGANIIRMPLLSDTMTEGVIAEWHKNVGDLVKSDDALADVETDKATMEVTGYADGVLLYIGVEKGQAAKVNDIIAIIGKAGTDVSALLKTVSAKSMIIPIDNHNTQVSEQAAVQPVVVMDNQSVQSESSGRIKASPLAKKIAKEKGINLLQVKGSAEGGRIVKKDIENFDPVAAPTVVPIAAPTTTAAATSPQSQKVNKDTVAPVAATSTVAIPKFTGEEKYTEKPVSQMRKVIAKRLSESLFTSPHFYLTMAIDMDSAMQARVKINEFASVKISFNDIVLKAVAIALKQHPNVNSSWLGDKIRYNEHVNIGVAVAVEDGLLVPVVRFADGKSLSQISAEVKDFAQRAKSKKLQPSDWEGSTFTISNLGMFGIDEFTAIINPPDACILAVGGIQQVPVVKNGVVVPGNVMKVTLSCDHRAVDGATGSAFLQTLKALLEEPVRLLV